MEPRAHRRHKPELVLRHGRNFSIFHHQKPTFFRRPLVFTLPLTSVSVYEVRLFQPDAQGILSTCGHSHLTVSYWVSKIYKSVESIQQDYYWERKKKSKKDFRICRRVITTVCWCFWVIYSAKMLTVCSFHGFHFSLKEMFYFLSFFLFF